VSHVFLMKLALFELGGEALQLEGTDDPDLHGNAGLDGGKRF